MTIDPTLIDWSRAQFALTAIYHWLFVPLTLGLVVVMAIMETIYYRTGKPFWKEASKFWQRLFGVNFAMGVATGRSEERRVGKECRSRWSPRLPSKASWRSSWRAPSWLLCSLDGRKCRAVSILLPHG